MNKKLTAFLFCTGCFLFVSCNDFLNGSSIKQKLDEDIQYANAPFYDINISSKYGKISPNGTYGYKETNKISLSFNADSEYQFICWKAFSDSTKKTEVPVENISFDQIENENTTLHFNKALATASTIYVEPVCVKRPKVVSAIPSYDPDGVYRDRSIIVIFDSEMEESSIYWTAEELMDLTDEKYKIEGTDYYYAYEDNDCPVFKNITIIKRLGGNNLLSFYEAPKFDEFDKSILRIKPKNQNEPPEATDILVTVKKDFSYYNKSNNAHINLSEDYSWSYYTNGSVDNEAPNFDTGYPVVKFSDDSGNSLSETKTAITGTPANYSSSIKNNNLTSKKIWVKAKITDVGGAGASAIKWNLYRENDAVYKQSAQSEKIASGQFELDSNFKVIHKNGATTEEGTAVDLSAYLLDGTEGMYKFELVGSDKNGNEKVEDYYFVYDTKAPEKVTVNYILLRTKSIKMNLSISESTNNYKLEISKNSAANEDFNLNTDLIVSGLNSKGNNKLDIRLKDYCNNYSENCEVEFNLTPEPGMIYYSDGYWSKDYISTKTPEGVICNIKDDNSFHIWDIWDQYGYCWIGVEDNVSCSTVWDEIYNCYTETECGTEDGLKIYKWLKNNIPDNMTTLTGFGRDNAKSSKALSMWTYVIDKNNETNPEGVTEEWFYPTTVEFKDYIFQKLDKLDPVFTSLKTNYKHTEFEEIQHLSFASTFRKVNLFTYRSHYWVPLINTARSGHGIALAVHSSATEGGLWTQADQEWLGMGCPGGEYVKKFKLNNSSEQTYYLIRGGGDWGEAALFYLDRSLYSSGWNVSKESFHKGVDMQVHAMALITFTE